MADISAPVGAENKETETNEPTPVVEAEKAPVATPVETEKVEEKVTEPTEAEKLEESDDTKPISYRKSKALMSENKGLRAKNKELAGETEALKAKIAELEGNLSTASRSTIASKYGLTEAQQKFLTGSTVDELESSAKELVSAWGKSPAVDFSKVKTGTENNKSSGVEGLSREDILARLN